MHEAEDEVIRDPVDSHIAWDVIFIESNLTGIGKRVLDTGAENDTDLTGADELDTAWSPYKPIKSIQPHRKSETQVIRGE